MKKSYFFYSKIGKITFFCLILVTLSLSGNLIALAQPYEVNPDFNPNYLISDESLSDSNSMTVEEIRDFLHQKGGTLADYIDPELKMPAYYLIWQTSQQFQVNPKFLITLLQKEQSLVTDPNPDQNQYDWATGYSCYGGICLDIYKGFSRQVRSAAIKFRSYMDDLNILGKHVNNSFCTFTKWCLGTPKVTQDQIMVTPQTKATAALYTYNPYQGNTIVDGLKIGANYNFWKIWHSWFELSIIRPNGTLLQAKGDKTVYLIRDGMKLPFASISVLISRFDPKNIITVDSKELLSYPLGDEIKFSQYSLIENPRKEIFLVVDDQLRKIASSDVFRTLGFNPEEIIDVTNLETDQMAKGDDITLQSSYPTGALIRDKDSGGVYFVQNGVKYPIMSPEILKVNYPSQRVAKGKSDELDKYPKGDFVKFKDGTLIKAKNDDKVYVIADGKKYHLKDEAAFLTRGYQWVNVIETSQAAIDIHQSGPELSAIATSTSPVLDLVNDQENLLPATTTQP